MNQAWPFPGRSSVRPYREWEGDVSDGGRFGSLGEFRSDRCGSVIVRRRGAVVAEVDRFEPLDRSFQALGEFDLWFPAELIFCQ